MPGGPTLRGFGRAACLSWATDPDPGAFGQIRGDGVGDFLQRRRSGTVGDGQRDVGLPVDGEPRARRPDRIAHLEPLHIVDQLQRGGAVEFQRAVQAAAQHDRRTVLALPGTGGGRRGFHQLGLGVVVERGGQRGQQGRAARSVRGGRGHRAQHQRFVFGRHIPGHDRGDQYRDHQYDRQGDGGGDQRGWVGAGIGFGCFGVVRVGLRGALGRFVLGLVRADGGVLHR